MRGHVFAIGGLLAAGLVIGGCDVSVGDDGGVSIDLVSGIAEDEDQRTYTLPPDGELVIENSGGTVEIGAWDEAGVHVTISRQARARTDEAAAALLERIEIVEETTAARVSLATAAPRDRQIRVSYVVRAPASIATTVKNQNGRLEIDGMAGAVQATQSNGQIIATDINGPIQASVINGSVDLELADVGGAVSLATVNGPVRITIPTDAKADLTATVINGRIRTTGLTLEDLDEPSRREMSGRLNGGGPRITLETTNGPVAITGRD